MNKTDQTGNIVRHVEVKAYLDNYQAVNERVAALHLLSLSLRQAEITQLRSLARSHLLQP